MVVSAAFRGLFGSSDASGRFQNFSGYFFLKCVRTFFGLEIELGSDFVRAKTGSITKKVIVLRCERIFSL